jgi:hypothetical protein
MNKTLSFNYLTGLLPVFILVLSADCFAQMRSGELMKNYDTVFGVKLNQRSYPFDIILTDSRPLGNVLVPGEQPAFTFNLKNNLDKPLKMTGKFSVIAYGTRGIPGDIWLPEMYKIADLPAISVPIDVPAKGTQQLAVSASLPETFGAYALVLDLGAEGRRFATSCARTFATATEKIQYPKFSLDDVVGIPVLNRLGVQAIRKELGFYKRSDANYEKNMAKLDEELKHFADNNITVLLTLESGGEQPLGRGRPHLSPENVMLNTKQDLAWLPKDDDEFQYFVATLCKKYGWPKGPVTAVQLWNEPWEGISISGWGADMLRYREIYTRMALGVEEARKEGADVLITGCDSSTNSQDKLFGDGKDTFLKWFDACTIHYQGLTAPVLNKAWLERKSPHGRVKIWDTESWVANTDDRISTVIAANRAAGYDRAMGVYGGNLSTPLKQNVTLPDGSKKQVSLYHAWSTAAAVGAAQHFIGERDFHEILFKNGLPWVMVFDGEKGHPDDGTIVVVGDLKEAFNDFLLFRGVRGMAEIRRKEALTAKFNKLSADSPERPALQRQLATSEVLSDASLTMKNPDKEFILFDFYGNPQDASSKTLQMPLNHSGYFLRTTGKPGSFDRLVKAVAEARIDGYEPLNVIARDLQAPVSQKPLLTLGLTNILNRPVSGSLTVSLGKLALDVPKKLEFKAHETKEVQIPVIGGSASPDNTYPLSFRFDAGTDGYSTHQENLHVNFIAKRTISVDGNLDDWKDVLPEPVYADRDQGPSLMESAWLPFEKFTVSQKPGFATAYLAYDDKYFYFAAKIADNTPDDGTLRFEKRNDDDYYYPTVTYEYDPGKTVLKDDTVWQEPSRTAAALFLPGSKTGRSFAAWVSVAKQLGVSVELPDSTAKLVTFYFVDWDTHLNGRRAVKVQAIDAATNKPLAETVVREYGPGTYVTFRLTGKTKVIVSTVNWTNASLSGVFFDADNSGKTNVELVNTDLATGADWQSKYGKEGYLVIGAKPSYPADVKFAVLEEISKKEYRWPDGVRRFSYRKRPDLPFGSSPKFDNVQIAFNVIPDDQKLDMIAFPPGTMNGFVPRSDTDYEYALNKVSEVYGGGTEIWRCYTPGMPRKGFYPRQPASPFDGSVKNGKLVVKTDENTRIVEAALPWTEIPLVKEAMAAGKPVKFSFRVNDNQGPSMELSEGRSVAKRNSYTFHPEFVQHWSNEVEFSFEK